MTSATVNGNGGVAVNNASTGVISITGNVTAGASAAGANNASTGTFTITGDITATNGANGFTSSNTSATNRLSGSFINSANGTAAIYAAKYILNSTPLLAKTRYAKDGISQYVDMFTADNTGLGPATTDVRSGINYGGGLVGTCAVPAAGSVALGVPVDNTTGTAVLTQANVTTVVNAAIDAAVTATINPNVTTTINAAVPTAVSTALDTQWNKQTSTLTVAGSIGERLKNCATTQSVGDQLASLL